MGAMTQVGFYVGKLTTGVEQKALVTWRNPSLFTLYRVDKLQVVLGRRETDTTPVAQFGNNKGRKYKDEYEFSCPHAQR